MASKQPKEHIPKVTEVLHTQFLSYGSLCRLQVVRKYHWIAHLIHGISQELVLQI